MIIFTIASTKGGVGKTTLTANLGALLADMGLRVLLIDADVQPSLSKYFALSPPQPVAGLTEVIVRGEVAAESITPTVFPNLHLVASDDPEGRLPNWLLGRIDRGFRLRQALRAGLIPSAYDCILIDTPGAIGPLQDAAVMAADVVISPITPEILSAREFRDGTMELLARLEPGSALGAPLAPVKAVIYRQDRTADARLIVAGIAREFAKPPDHPQPRVSLLKTVVPHAKAYKEAATLRIPVHQHERRREGTMPSAWSVMHGLAWELMPSLRGVLADGRRVQGVSS
jgi:chromosome partitioning related protein ParA